MERIRPRRLSKPVSTASAAIGRSNPLGAARNSGSHDRIVAEIKQGCYDAAERAGNALARADALVTDKRKRALLTGSTGMNRYLDHLALNYPQLFMQLFGKMIPQEHEVKGDVEVTVNEGEAKQKLLELLNRRVIDVTPDQSGDAAALAAQGGRAGNSRPNGRDC
jgi:hypothetical protein